ncbi:hypothetical protein UlMin_018226 [Ulmus minor]
MGSLMTESKTQAMVRQHHNHSHLSPKQCGSNLVQVIDAPMALVWSVIRQFGNPQAYKQFVKSCSLRSGNGGIGSVREVIVISGLPASVSVERLEMLDDDIQVVSFSMIGGDHKLENYRSTISVHEEVDEGERVGWIKTVVIESYVVDVPGWSSKEDTCSFADTIVRCNLLSLARITENMALSSN